MLYVCLIANLDLSAFDSWLGTCWDLQLQKRSVHSTVNESQLSFYLLTRPSTGFLAKAEKRNSAKQETGQRKQQRLDHTQHTVYHLYSIFLRRRLLTFLIIRQT